MNSQTSILLILAAILLIQCISHGMLWLQLFSIRARFDLGFLDRLERKVTELIGRIKEGWGDA